MIIPFGFAAIAGFQYVLRVPRTVLMPVILGFCMVGAFAVENTVFAILTMAIMGLVAFVLEENDYPLAPAILGLVIGPMLEENLLLSLTRARGDIFAFVERPLSLGLAIVAITLCIVPLVMTLMARVRQHERASR